MQFCVLRKISGSMISITLKIFSGMYEKKGLLSPFLTDKDLHSLQQHAVPFFSQDTHIIKLLLQSNVFKSHNVAQGNGLCSCRAPW